MRLFERRTRSTAAAEACSSGSATDGESEEEEEQEQTQRAWRSGAASCSGADQTRRGAGRRGAAQRGGPAANGKRAAAAAEACRRVPLWARWRRRKRGGRYARLRCRAARGRLRLCAPDCAQG